MASTSALQRLVSTALLLSIGAFRGALMMISVALQVLLKGKCVLEPKERREEPECLRDPALGSHEFVTLEDVTLHYVSAGSRDKPLVLLLHGFPDFWFSWKCQILDLKKDFWVVAPDLRGYGQSSKPANVDDYQTFKLIEDVHGLVKSLGRSKVTIVGHDWGAVIAWCFATKHEDMVEKLIIVNGPHPMAMQHQLHNSLDQIVKSW
ncbi:epoxide hydrolase 4 [Dermacentor silvarum]|uniref:epoxide hydrolase 4 n=1 Tax=Dermacentor silvarum TaxID=543639 RepID=UPI00189A1635|nr:epoxide hydrolase 4 [Dermacentor silvarum]